MVLTTLYIWPAIEIICVSCPLPWRAFSANCVFFVQDFQDPLPSIFFDTGKPFFFFWGGGGLPYRPPLKKVCFLTSGWPKLWPVGPLDQKQTFFKDGLRLTDFIIIDFIDTRWTGNKHFILKDGLSLPSGFHATFRFSGHVKLSPMFRLASDLPKRCVLLGDYSIGLS